MFFALFSTGIMILLTERDYNLTTVPSIDLMSQQNTNRKLYLAVKRNHLCAVLMSVSAKSRLWHLLTSAHNMVKGYYQHLSRYYTEF